MQGKLLLCLLKREIAISNNQAALMTQIFFQAQVLFNDPSEFIKQLGAFSSLISGCKNFVYSLYTFHLG